MTNIVDIYLGLGSNRDAEANILAGIERLKRDFQLITVSPWYRSPAMGFSGSDFINLVVHLRERINDDEDLIQFSRNIKQIEYDFGRTNETIKYSSRHLDIDILLVGDRVQELDIISEYSQSSTSSKNVVNENIVNNNNIQDLEDPKEIVSTTVTSTSISKSTTKATRKPTTKAISTVRLPRPDIWQYAFVLRPLLDIAPDLKCPKAKHPISDYWSSVKDQTLSLVDSSLSNMD